MAIELIAVAPRGARRLVRAKNEDGNWIGDRRWIGNYSSRVRIGSSRSTSSQCEHVALVSALIELAAAQVRLTEFVLPLIV